MSRDPKTPEQLKGEIAYYRWELGRRKPGSDRVRRAERAIRIRERQLAAIPPGRGLAPNASNNALQRVAGGARR